MAGQIQTGNEIPFTSLDRLLAYLDEIHYNTVTDWTIIAKTHSKGVNNAPLGTSGAEAPEATRPDANGRGRPEKGHPAAMAEESRATSFHRLIIPGWSGPGQGARQQWRRDKSDHNQDCYQVSHDVFPPLSLAQSTPMLRDHLSSFC